MNFYSTNRKSKLVSFREAVYQSLPSDNGLYFPENIPTINPSPNSSLQELAFQVLFPYAKDDLEKTALERIVTDALNFEIPLKEVEKNIHSLELFHGPTYAFKDVGARFLARCLGYFNAQNNQEITILVATSGDTGGAVASGFHNVEGVNVLILYPSGKVSELQEKQLTTLGGNIQAIEVDGTFDDCQHLVKEAFLDQELRQRKNLSSANSINIARWIPQSIYYFWLSQQLASDNLVVSVPSGNYGNLAAGLLAKKMGAPISRFVASSNLNDVVPRYLETKSYEPKSTIHTYSNAMDVGNPSNFPRILELFDKNYESIISTIHGDRLNDEETLKVIAECYSINNYLLDPHGAIGYQLLKNSLDKNEVGVFLETAHPCKFLPVISKVVHDYKIPDFANGLLALPKQAVQMSNNYNDFKGFLS